MQLVIGPRVVISNWPPISRSSDLSLLAFSVRHICFVFRFALLRDSQSQALKFAAKQAVTSVVTRAAKQKLLQKVELESTLRNMLSELATLYFAARLPLPLRDHLTISR